MKIVRKIVAVGLLGVGLLFVGCAAPDFTDSGPAASPWEPPSSPPAADYASAPEPAVQWGSGSVNNSFPVYTALT